MIGDEAGINPHDSNREWTRIERELTRIRNVPELERARPGPAAGQGFAELSLFVDRLIKKRVGRFYLFAPDFAFIRGC